MRWFFLLFALCAVIFPQDRLRAASLADETIVVFNSTDPDATELAHYYAARRNIPDEHIVSLRCPPLEEITREQYDQYIAIPLRKKFDEEGWWSGESTHPDLGPVVQNSIRYIALIRGMPLKISACASYPGDKPGTRPVIGTRNEASVDSELAVLGARTAQISGPLDNPYFEAHSRFDAVDLPQMMLVSRLDGPAAGDVKRMIDDSIRVERTGLWGWACLDARGTELPGYKQGDDWINAASSTLRAKGFPVFTDNLEAILPSGLPLPKTAFYFGWYASDFSGALQDADFKFTPGAVACHIHSFSASTLRSRTIGWCGPLVSNGADAVLGNVYEPYLVLTTNLGIFTDRLLRGFTFAESAWAATQTTSWMTVNIGDPLYRPYAVLDDGLKVDRGLVQDFAPTTETGPADSSTGFLSEAWAQRKLAEGDRDAAGVLFQRALDKYREPDALARVTWSYSQLLLAQGRKSQAISLVRRIQKRILGSSSSVFLVSWLLQLDPPPAPPPSATPDARNP